MLKRLFIIPFLAMFLFAGVAQAQTDTLPDPGMLPDNPLFILKDWSEKIGTFFTFDDEKKAERFLKLSERRLAEADAMREKGKPEIAERHMVKYQEQLEHALAKAEKAKENGKNMDAVLTRLSEATLRHEEHMAEVYERAPEKAQKGLERAMEMSARGHVRAMQAIRKENQEQVKERVMEKRRIVEQKFKAMRQRGANVPDITEIEDEAETEIEE
ncbi:hypothetical protein KKE33_04445 [Patescibacteria group bacterium]|nr:hypothetical protein [Patescibacteria group bacterium]